MAIGVADISINLPRHRRLAIRLDLASRAGAAAQKVPETHREELELSAYGVKAEEAASFNIPLLSPSPPGMQMQPAAISDSPST